MQYDTYFCKIRQKMLFETMSANDCTLQNHQVDIWEIPLCDLPPWAFASLNPEEKTRAKRFHFPRHQRRFTVARALLRFILSRYLGGNPQDIDFTLNTHGKPFLTHNPHKLQFNVSHSKDTALIAIGVNVDLEYFSDRPYLGIAEHVFSAEEIDALSALPEKAQAGAFFAVWAQKEAFIKAVGMGLSYPLKQLTVPLTHQTNTAITDSLTQKTWHLSAFMLNPTCAAALCVAPSITRVRKITLDTLADFATS